MPSKTLSVSVVIPSYNGKQLLQKHLPEVIKASLGAQIIVVDDASTDGSVPYLHERFPKIKVVALARNGRFAAACNAGANYATGDIIVLLNNDVSPKPDFLTPLIEAFSDPAVAAAGCAEVKDNSDAPEISGRSGGDFIRGMIIHWRAQNQAGQDTFWISGGSGAYRKTVWEKLGGMDTLYYPAYEEDRDLSYRMLKRGYRLAFVPQSKVTHCHETTNAAVFGKRRMAIASYRNSLLFIWKNITWKKMIWEHVIWLPFHFLVTGLSSGGLYWIGLWQALGQLHLVRQARRKEIEEATKNDQEIFTWARDIV